MAKVIWTIKADRLFDKYVFNAFLEYGQKTSKKWKDFISQRLRMQAI